MERMATASYVEFLLPRAEKAISPAALVTFCLALQSHLAIVFHVSAVLSEAQILRSTIDAQGVDPWHTVSRLRLAETEEALPDTEWRAVTTYHPFETSRDVESSMLFSGNFRLCVRRHRWPFVLRRGAGMRKWICWRCWRSWWWRRG
jgi:hypothetical protein